jgi:hypothetical protein
MRWTCSTCSPAFTYDSLVGPERSTEQVTEMVRQLARLAPA